MNRDTFVALEPATTEELRIAGEAQALLLAELSNAMVRLYKERFGRSPTPGADVLRRTRCPGLGAPRTP